jgi:hypothetical protein
MQKYQIYIQTNISIHLLYKLNKTQSYNRRKIFEGES